MPATTALEFLEELNIDEIMEDLQDIRKTDPRLVQLSRMNFVEMDNSQLLGRRQKRVQIAPLISTNARSPVFRAQQFSAQSGNLGKIKLGTQWSEEEMEEWLDLVQSPVRDPDGVLARGMVEDAIADHLEGIRKQQNWLATAMALDGQVGTSSYNRFGFFLDGISWSRYSDLKVTVTPWTNHTDADPIADLWMMKELRMEKYGKDTNRATMPSAAFRHAIQCDKYKARTGNYLSPTMTYEQMPGVMTDFQMNLFQQIAGIRVVFDDARWENERDDKVWESNRFLPLNPTTPVILDDSNDDNNNGVHFMGVGTPMEGRMREVIGGRTSDTNRIGGPAGPVRRIISYGYLPEKLDPPTLTVFSATKSMPQLRDRASNGVLYVGPMTETYAVTDYVPE